jgi:hypothetical protein
MNRFISWRERAGVEALQTDPIHMFTLIEAQSICDEELANEVTDWDRYADAWWRVQELTPERPEPDQLERRRGLPSSIAFAITIIGILLVTIVSMTTMSPVLLVLGAGMMGLPGILGGDAYVSLYALLVAGTVLALGPLGKSLDSQAQALRRAHNADVIALRNIQASRARHCEQTNQILRTAKLPLVDCKRTVLR